MSEDSLTKKLVAEPTDKMLFIIIFYYIYYEYLTIFYSSFLTCMVSK